MSNLKCAAIFLTPLKEPRLPVRCADGIKQHAVTDDERLVISWFPEAFHGS